MLDICRQMGQNGNTQVTMEAPMVIWDPPSTLVLFSFRSPLIRKSQLVSFPSCNKMLQFHELYPPDHAVLLLVRRQSAYQQVWHLSTDMNKLPHLEQVQVGCQFLQSLVKLLLLQNRTVLCWRSPRLNFRTQL